MTGIKASGGAFASSLALQPIFPRRDTDTSHHITSHQDRIAAKEKRSISQSCRENDTIFVPQNPMK